MDFNHRDQQQVLLDQHIKGRVRQFYLLAYLMPLNMTIFGLEKAMLDTLSTLFKRQYLWNEAINHIAVLSPNNVILRSIR